MFHILQSYSLKGCGIPLSVCIAINDFVVVVFWSILSTAPSEIDRVMKDWQRLTSLQERLEASCFDLDCLKTTALRRLRVVFAQSCSTPHHYCQLPKQQWHELEGSSAS